MIQHRVLRERVLRYAYSSISCDGINKEWY
jgi:hypothetical protein